MQFHKFCNFVILFCLFNLSYCRIHNSIMHITYDVLYVVYCTVLYCIVVVVVVPNMHRIWYSSACTLQRTENDCEGNCVRQCAACLPVTKQLFLKRKTFLPKGQQEAVHRVLVAQAHQLWLTAATAPTALLAPGLRCTPGACCGATPLDSMYCSSWAAETVSGSNNAKWPFVTAPNPPCRTVQ